ncbi:MAG: OadG family protein [Fusicatenibacter sp.]|nr:OadG family protein [Lachnospiraceae bacterium]MDY2938835.1 OadG family protein [Fusicatenibacter sp.]
MRKNWKKMISLILTAVCVFVITVAPVFAEAESTPEYLPIEESVYDQMLSSSVYLVQSITTEYTDEELESIANAGVLFNSRAVNAWFDNRDDLGALVEIGDSEYERDGDFVTCTIHAQFEKNPAIVRVFWNINTSQATDMTITVETAKSVLFKEAGMNTVVGVGIVFCVLVFLIFVISMFKFIGAGEEKKAKAAAKEKAAAKSVPAPAPVQAAPQTDDLELQAVIAAAIAMYEEEMSGSASTDAYTARPVRRRSNWKRA